MSSIYSYLSAPFQHCKRKKELKSISFDPITPLPLSLRQFTFCIGVESVTATLEKYNDETDSFVTLPASRELLEKLLDLIKNLCNSSFSLNGNYSLEDVRAKLDHADSNYMKSMVVAYKNASDTVVEIPYNFSDPQESFPCEREFDMILTKEVQKPSRVTLVHEENNVMKQTDLTKSLRNMTCGYMKCGFNLFRPHAWQFLTELSDDASAILLLHYKDPDEKNKIQRMYIPIHDMTVDGLRELTI